MRSTMYSLWSSSAAVTPPTLASTPLPASASGRTVSRRCLTRSSVASSWGEVVGVTVRIAALPDWLICGSAHEGDAVFVAQLCARESIVASRAARSGSSAAITSGPLAPGPKPSLSRS